MRGTTQYEQSTTRYGKDDVRSQLRLFQSPVGVTEGSCDLPFLIFVPPNDHEISDPMAFFRAHLAESRSWAVKQWPSGSVSSR